MQSQNQSTQSHADKPRRYALRLADEERTARLGAALAPVLRTGDTVLLRGPLGAGKSALARAIIAAALGDPAAEIPSPSYTLVNVYETPQGAIWHADLYRLTGAAEEMEELGLDEAAGAALVLIEWPERLGDALPRRCIEVTLSTPPSGGRNAKVELHGAGWDLLETLLAGWR